MTVLHDCGCCEGIAVETPVEVSNRAGLSAIAYRVGTHARFKASMLARLSGNDVQELANLKTRDEDDFTIALVDAWAVVADILTFYQERIANESYLRTATERQSIIDLARLIGYELRPGVAASTYLAFTMETGAGAPESITIDAGQRVQSVPGPGEKPQTFESGEAIEARPEWNALIPLQAQIRAPQADDTSIVLAGVTTNLRAGDVLLFVGNERVSSSTSNRWQFRRVATVKTDADNDRTTVTWNAALAADRVPLANPRVYALRLRASIFGYNAQPWLALPDSLRGANQIYAGRQNTWNDAVFAAAATSINLDSAYSQVVPDSWLVLESSNNRELYSVTAVAEEPKADFNITAKTTRVTLSGTGINNFSPANAAVFAQSEEIGLGATPLKAPVQGDTIELANRVDGLQPERTLIVSGKRMRVMLVTSVTRVTELTSADGKRTVPIGPRDSLIVAKAPIDLDDNTLRRWTLIDRTGFEGTIDVPTSSSAFAFAPANDDDAVVSEVVTLEEAELSGTAERTILHLVDALQNVYDRTTVTIYANVAPATHGETVSDEVLGSGDGGKPFQKFELKQGPLTHTPSDTPSGGASTLEVRVNDLRWSEVDTLFGRGPRDRVYVSSIDDEGTTTVQFGDGYTGARLPKGSENVRATYRKGIGLEGLVQAGQLSLLMTRPLGLRGVINPLPAEGAQDPQMHADARTNAPITVLTLDRIVSLQDYEDYARAFSGIAKSLATWTWTGQTRQVFVTVAGINGAAAGTDLHDRLVASMQKAGDGFVPVAVASYRPVTFKVAGTVKIDPDFVEEKVLAAVEDSLRASFSFDARAFGQPVTLSEVIAVMQDVDGVIAVDINKLHRTDDTEARHTFLRSDAPQVGSGADVLAAELLTLDPGPMDLTVMP